MIPKSGYRSSEKIMLKQRVRAGGRLDEKSSRSSARTRVNARLGLIDDGRRSGGSRSCAMAPRSHPLRGLAAAALVALAAGGCLKRGPAGGTGSPPPGGPADVTGSTGPVEAARRDTQAWAARFEADPGDGGAAIGYAAALRQSDQH